MDMPECDIQTRKVAKCVRRLTLRLAVLIYLLIAAVAIFAQANPRDYSISLPRVSYTADGTVAVVNFTVGNRGGDAREPSQIIISENQTGQVAVKLLAQPMHDTDQPFQVDSCVDPHSMKHVD